MILGKYDPRKGEIFQVLNEEAKLVRQEFAPSVDVLRALYHHMLVLRAVDDKAFTLQRQGRMGTYPQVRGAEAIQIASAFAMGKADWLVPSYREIGIMQQRGVKFSDVWRFWLGNEIGNKMGKGVNVLPIAVPVGSQMLHGTGIAMAAQYKGDKLAVLACCGDGATSEGEVHEAFNFAGVNKSPVVFLITNNQFAISVPRCKQTASRTIAEKAYAYGFEGITVDGMDACAMYATMKEALDFARQGGGPVLVEALTYRICDHTTADDASIYQNKEECESWKLKDGVVRLRDYLAAQNAWSDADEAKAQAAAKQAVEDTVKELESTPSPTPNEIFEHTFAEMPWNLQEQLAELKQFYKADAGH